LLRASGAVVKLGGSVLADKSRPEPGVDRQLLRRVADELGSVAVRPLVLVHGAGSYGHPIVQSSGIDHGLGSLESRLSMGETQRRMYLLSAEVARALLDAGLPVMPVQASALAIMCDRELAQMDLSVVHELVGQGMVPLLYGVPAVDSGQGCSILSGDVIAPRVAAELGLPLLVHATNVDGVFDADPASYPDARQIRRIDERNWEQVRALLSGSSQVDVTGGMAGKIEALLELARTGIITRIVSARIAGRVRAVLSGADVGTLIVWGNA
jgi:isopentenyl phosphate kinase